MFSCQCRREREEVKLVRERNADNRARGGKRGRAGRREQRGAQGFVPSKRGQAREQRSAPLCLPSLMHLFARKTGDCRRAVPTTPLIVSPRDGEGGGGTQGGKRRARGRAPMASSRDVRMPGSPHFQSHTRTRSVCPCVLMQLPRAARKHSASRAPEQCGSPECCRSADNERGAGKEQRGTGGPQAEEGPARERGRLGSPKR